MAERKGDGLSGAAALRLVVRHLTDLALARGLRWQATTGLERIDCMLFGLLLSGGMAQHSYRESDGRWNGLHAYDRLQRPLNAAAVARSIGLPYETTRRRLRAMADAGVVAIDAKGVTVATAFLQQLWESDVIAEDVDALRATLVVLARDGYAAAQAVIDRLPLALPDDVQARMLMDFSQRTLEPFLVQHGDLITGTVTAGIIDANVRHLARKPALSSRYAAASRPPPDALRQPVTVRALARELDLPFETVRRKVSDQAARGLIAASEDGVIVPTAVLQHGGYEETNTATMRHFERMLRDLQRWAVADPK